MEENKGGIGRQIKLWGNVVCALIFLALAIGAAAIGVSSSEAFKIAFFFATLCAVIAGKCIREVVKTVKAGKKQYHDYRKQ